MADQSAIKSIAGFGDLAHSPGNPLFPTLPGSGDPIVGKIGATGLGAELRVPFFEPQTDYIQTATKSSVGFGEWFLNQIWVTPTPIDFGDIADQKDVDVTFFSSYLDPVTMNNIEIPISNLDIADPTNSPLFPLDLSSFTDTTLVFRADQAGPQQFDDYLVITVDGEAFEIRTLGRRVLLLFGEPENGAVETLNFATDLMRSKSGLEQAYSLRLAPYSEIRYLFRFPADLDYKRTLMEALLVGGAPVLPYGVQFWWEAEKIAQAATALDATVYIDHSLMQINVGETMVFTTPSRVNVTGTIASISNSPMSVTFEQPLGTALPLDTYGMPVRFGHLTADPSLSTARINLGDIAVSVRTEGDIDISNLDSAYFDFHTVESPARPIWTSRCMRSARMRGSIYRETEELDSITGRLFVTGTESMGEWSTNAFMWLNSKAEIRAWREFLHYMRGDWGTFYVPTFQNDLPLATPLVLGGADFTVPYMGIKAYLDGAVPYRDLRIQLEDGTVEYKRIGSIVDNGDGTETITVDSVIGTGSPAFSSIAGTRISWMHLCRMEGDVAKFTHTYLGQAELAFRVRSVKE